MSRQTTKKEHVRTELFPKDDNTENQSISQDAKDSFKERGNLAAHEILSSRCG